MQAKAKANPLTLALWALTLLSDKGRLNLGALTEVELAMAVAALRTKSFLRRHQ